MLNLAPFMPLLVESDSFNEAIPEESTHKHDICSRTKSRLGCRWSSRFSVRPRHAEA